MNDNDAFTARERLCHMLSAGINAIIVKCLERVFFREAGAAQLHDQHVF